MTASELVLDILVVDQAGAYSGQSLCRAGELMGLNPVSVKVALHRLCTQGKIDRVSRGWYRLVSNPIGLLLYISRWSTHARAEIPWIGKWIAVHDSLVVPANKVEWRRHQLALHLRGFTLWQPSLWVRPDNRRGGTVQEEQVLRELNLSSSAKVLGVTSINSKDMTSVMRLWAPQQLDTQYLNWVERLQQSDVSLTKLSLDEAVAETLTVGRELIAFLAKDPLLPEEIMRSDVRKNLFALAVKYQKRAILIWREWFEAVQHKEK